MLKIKKHLTAIAVMGFATIVSKPTFAAEMSERVSSGGGVQITDRNSEYWFQLGGRLQLDGAVFTGSQSDRSGFPSGTNIRRAFLDVSGGVGNNWFYGLSIDFGNVTNNTTTLNDAYIGYVGFDKSYVSVGQIYIPLGLEDTTSSLNLFFMERSLMTTALYPGYGIGVYGETQMFENVSLMGGFFNPSDDVLQSGSTTTTGSDPLRIVGRAAFAPIQTTHEVWHMGISGMCSSNHRRNALVFSTAPELRARSTSTLSTGSILGVDKYYTLGLEAASKMGPLVVMGEYQNLHLNRNAFYGNNLDYDGYSLMAGYVLTGEERPYDSRSGTFGGVKPTSKNGAWEVSARYSMASLGDQVGANTVVGAGTEHNVTLGLSWWYTANMRILANYVRAHKPAGVDLDAFGLRAQVNW